MEDKGSNVKGKNHVTKPAARFPPQHQYTILHTNKSQHMGSRPGVAQRQYYYPSPTARGQFVNSEGIEWSTRAHVPDIDDQYFDEQQEYEGCYSEGDMEDCPWTPTELEEFYEKAILEQQQLHHDIKKKPAQQPPQ